jgi:hypothetical protein
MTTSPACIVPHDADREIGDSDSIVDIEEEIEKSLCDQCEYEYEYDSELEHEERVYDMTHPLGGLDSDYDECNAAFERERASGHTPLIASACIECEPDQVEPIRQYLSTECQIESSALSKLGVVFARNVTANMQHVLRETFHCTRVHPVL